MQRLLPPLQDGVFLFLGEASFGFTSALNRLGAFGNQKRVVCTSFETEQRARELFGTQLTDNVSGLRQNPFVEVLFGVDATNLQRSFPQQEPCFSTVCFMFPALAIKGRIDLSRKLLRDSCVSVAPHLQRDGMLLVALAAGQGGTDAELPAHVREPDNTWKIVECASYGDLFLQHAVQVAAHPWGTTDYQPTGRRGNNSAFRSAGAVMHTFVKRDHATHAPTHALVYEPRDLSFFMPRDGVAPDEAALLAAVTNHHAEARDVIVLDQFIHPNTGRRSVTLRMALVGFLSPADANELQCRIGATLTRLFGVDVR